MPQMIGSGLMGLGAVALVLGLCLMFHEAGHFLVAKLSRMLVHEFALGFGPTIVSWRRGDTKYAWRLIPFGAFVRIAGMEPGEADVKDGFHSRPRWAGALVIFAGPAMNVVLAVLLFTILALTQGMPVPGDRGLLVTGYPSAGTPAEKAGVLKGDRIVAVDGNREALMITAVQQGSPAARAGLTEKMRILQVGEDVVAVPVDIVSRIAGSKGEVTFACADTMAQSLSQVAQLVPLSTRDLPRPPSDTAAATNYCREVLGLTFEPLDNEAVVSYVSGHPEKTVVLTVTRNGQDVTISVMPRTTWERVAVINADGQLDAPHRQVGRIGVILGTARQPVGLVVALEQGVGGSLGALIGAVETFRAMIGGHVSAESASGPVGIMAMSAETAKRGFGEVLAFCGMISVSLAVVNLFPIPPFDGFHIVLLGYESVIRRRIDAKKQIIIMVGGFVFVVALFVLLTAKDLTNLIMYRTP